MAVTEKSGNTKHRRWPWMVVGVLVLLTAIGAVLPSEHKSPAAVSTARTQVAGKAKTPGAKATPVARSKAKSKREAEKYMAEVQKDEEHERALVKKAEQENEPPEPEQEARRWISKHENQVGQVKMVVENVFNVTKHQNPSEPRLAWEEVAAAAIGAHLSLDEVRKDFASLGGRGGFGEATREVATAVVDLDQMESKLGHAAEGYADNPTEANVEQLMSDYAPEYTSARSNWNEGIGTIWRLAREPESIPPTI